MGQPTLLDIPPLWDFLTLGRDFRLEVGVHLGVWGLWGLNLGGPKFLDYLGFISRSRGQEGSGH